MPQVVPDPEVMREKARLDIGQTAFARVEDILGKDGIVSTDVETDDQGNDYYYVLGSSPTRTRASLSIEEKPAGQPSFTKRPLAEITSTYHVYEGDADSGKRFDPKNNEDYSKITNIMDTLASFKTFDQRQRITKGVISTVAGWFKKSKLPLK